MLNIPLKICSCFFLPSSGFAAEISMGGKWTKKLQAMGIYQCDL